MDAGDHLYDRAALFTVSSVSGSGGITIGQHAAEEWNSYACLEHGENATVLELLCSFVIYIYIYIYIYICVCVCVCVCVCARARACVCVRLWNNIRLDHTVRPKYNISSLKKISVKDSRKSSHGGRTIACDADKMPLNPQEGVTELITNTNNSLRMIESCRYYAYIWCRKKWESI